MTTHTAPKTVDSTSTNEPREKKNKLDQKRLGRLLVGVIALLLSIGYLINALNMPLGQFNSPGPGMFPAATGIGAVVISAIVIVESLMNVGESGSLELPTGRERSNSLIFFSSLALFILLIPVLGQYLASVLYVIATLKFIGRMTWVKSVLLGAILAIGVTALFVEGFGLQLPTGIW